MLNRKPMNVVSIESGRVSNPDPDPSPVGAAAHKRKGPKTENQFSRRRFFTLIFGGLGCSISQAHRETGYPKREGEFELVQMARPEYERQNRKAA